MPATPAVVPRFPYNNYYYFHGTSFATAQTSALAALLFHERPDVSHYVVKHRIIYTRNTDIEQQVFQQYGIPLAGLVDFTAAFEGWGY